jgi:hypothetical protein
MLNAGSAKNEEKACGAPSKTPAQTETGSRPYGLIGDSWSKLFRIAPCGLKTMSIHLPIRFASKPSSP